jgi:HPr kinase/phosphorylase
MDRGHRLVCDDLVWVRVRDDGGLVGSALEENVRIEVRGLGVFPAAEIFKRGAVSSAPVNVVVDLDVYDPYRDAGRIAPEIGKVTILGKEVPQVRLPLVTGVQPALLVEILTNLLQKQGIIRSE